jgi:hypothetical protein
VNPWVDQQDRISTHRGALRRSNCSAHIRRILPGPAAMHQARVADPGAIKTYSFTGRVPGQLLPSPLPCCTRHGTSTRYPFR